MSRPLREQVAGGIYHVYARGNNKAPLFLDHADHELYLAMLAKSVRKHGWRLMSYCLMPNHVHLIVETPEPNLGDGMRLVHGEYARRFNARHGRCGHVFQGRYGAKRMRDDAQFWMAARYVARNPVDAGLCATPTAWRWGSYAAIVKRRRETWVDGERLLELLSGTAGDPLERYVELVEAA